MGKSFKPKKTEQLNVRLDPGEKARWTRCAKHSGEYGSLAEWVRTLVRDEVERFEHDVSPRFSKRDNVPGAR